MANEFGEKESTYGNRGTWQKELYRNRYPQKPGPRGWAILFVGVIAAACLAVGIYLHRAGDTKDAAPAAMPVMAVSNIGPTSATISWSTPKPTSSQVEYGPTPAYGMLSAFSSMPATIHSVNLTGLKSGQTYNYATLSTDAAGVVTTSPNASFTTAGGGNPTISNATAAVTSSSATITWTTDQPLTSQVEYGATTSYGSLSAFSSSMVTSHSVTVTALNPGTTYNFAALSTNSSGQISTSSNSTFTTPGAAGVTVVSNVAAPAVTANSATITWETDQASSSQVEYGLTADRGSLSAFNARPVSSHSLTITGLKPGTTYHYAALSANSAGKVGTSPDMTFTTHSIGGGPVISGVNTSNITSTSATINWVTDQPSGSQVEYGVTAARGSLSAYIPTLVTSHSVTLRSLTPGTAYSYVALSTDTAGQVGKSPNMTFLAGAGPPVIRQVFVKSVTATSATIAWMTDQPSTAQVDYGEASMLWSLLHRHRKPYSSQSSLDSSLLNTHSITLTGLKPETTYDFAVRSTNGTGMENISPNLKVKTSGR